VVVNVPQQGALVQQVPVPVPAVASQQLPMEWAAEDAVLNYKDQFRLYSFRLDWSRLVYPGSSYRWSGPQGTRFRV
jgi:hypothetical protein